MTVYTESVQFKADEKLIRYIEEKLSKMDQFFDRIIEARVFLKLENSGQIKDKIAEVRLSVPGTVLFASSSSKTFEASIDEAAQALKRQLVKYKERMKE